MYVTPNGVINIINYLGKGIIIMKKFLASAALAAVMLTAVSMTNSAEAGKIEDIQKAGVIKIGTTQDYVPMSYIDKKTGELKGHDIELGKALAASLNVKPEFVKTSWKNLTADTKAGKFDVAISGITRNYTRQAEMDLSKGYLNYNGRTILCRKADAKKFTSLEKIDQPGVKVVYNVGGGNMKFAKANIKKATLVEHDPNDENPGLVADGKVDVMITEVVEALHYIHINNKLAAPLIEKPFGGRNDFGILTQAGDWRFMRYLDLFIEKSQLDGTLKRLEAEL